MEILVELWGKFQKILGKLWLKFREILCRIWGNFKEILKEIWQQFFYYFFKFVKKLRLNLGIFEKNLYNFTKITSRYLFLFVNYYLLIIKRICLVKTVSFYFHRFLLGMYILLFFGVISIFLKLISAQNE